jgi:hypothetical protein
VAGEPAVRIAEPAFHSEVYWRMAGICRALASAGRAGRIVLEREPAARCRQVAHLAEQPPGLTRVSR